jgi:hypothetical protein
MTQESRTRERRNVCQGLCCLRARCAAARGSLLCDIDGYGTADFAADFETPAGYAPSRASVAHRPVVRTIVARVESKVVWRLQGALLAAAVVATIRASLCTPA